MTHNEPVVYFHGMPGGPSEIEAFGIATYDGRSLGPEAMWYAPNRVVMSQGSNLQQSFDNLASAISARFEGSAVRFVGFSLGTYVALEVARRMQSRVSHISLISAAAPLSAGDFMPDMAGKRVFQSARYSPLLLTAMASVQSLVLRVAPHKLFNALFASAQGMDRDLAARPDFRAKIIEGLEECLRGDTMNYRRELRGYVQDWSAILPLITQPVELWHGSHDNWAPPAMSEMLANALPNITAFHRLEGQSHYSTLQTFCASSRKEYTG
jgi:pimeloyl-ACP methyl ester carboxylesterase